MARPKKTGKTTQPDGAWQARITLFRFVMESVVTLVLLVVALYTIVSNGENQQWAIGAVGLICGYWLHSQPRLPASPRAR
jgi:hypothetical protein